MPELPEVETIVRELRKRVIGLKIRDVWSDREKTVRQAGGLKNLKKETKNKKILSVGRRAKYIVIDIEGKKSLFIHQKISGHLLYGKWKKAVGKYVSIIKGPLSDDSKNDYIRVIFFLSNGFQLALSDLRRFGKVILVDDDQVKNLIEIKELGPEPLEINFSEFSGIFKRKKGRIKQVLMDPKVIAGIGNIYSDEILWQAGIHPLSRVENLKDKDFKKIFKATREILKKAIIKKGSSNDDYRLPSGQKGGYQKVQKAYHRTGEKCGKKDGGIITRIKIGGRSAHFCPVHQKLFR